MVPKDPMEDRGVRTETLPKGSLGRVSVAWHVFLLHPMDPSTAGETDLGGRGLLWGRGTSPLSGGKELELVRAVLVGLALMHSIGKL